MTKYLFTKKVKLKDKKHFLWENGIWTGNEKPLRKIRILRNTNFNENGFFDFSNVAEIEIEEKHLPQKLLQRNDILIERSGGGPNTPVGRAALYDGEKNLYSFSNFTSRVRIISDEIDPEYIHKYLLHLHWNKHTEKIQTQTTNIRNLEFDKYLSFEVLLPETKKDQQTINYFIKEKFANVEQMRQAALQQKEAVAAMQGALLREVFPYKEGEKLPEEWRWEMIGDIIQKSVKFFSKEGVEEFTYLDISAIDNFQKKILDPKKIDVKDSPSRAKYLLNEGDILISNVRPNLNAVAIVTKEYSDSVGSSGFTIIRPSEICDTGFLFLFFISPYFIEYVTDLVQGAMYPAISEKDIYNCFMPVPNLIRQREIYDRTSILRDKVFKINENVNAQLEAIEALPAAILREVFEFKS